MPPEVVVLPEVVVPPDVVVPPEVVEPPDVDVLPDDGFVEAVELIPVPAFPLPPQPASARLKSSSDTVPACAGGRETNNVPRFISSLHLARCARRPEKKT